MPAVPIISLDPGPLPPLTIALMAGVAGAYARRAHTLALDGRPVPRRRQACFYGGLATILIAYISPIGALSDQLLAVHMVEHLLMGDIGALLIVLGLTGPLIAPILRLGAFNRLRVLAHPAIALPLWLIDLYVWHLPVLYQATLRHDGLHALEHTMFIAFGINMWMCLFGPLPTPTWFGNAARLVYIIAVRLGGMVLGNILTWSGTVFYPIYGPTEARLARLAARRPDQRRGGDDDRVQPADDRPARLAVHARGARERGAPAAARLRLRCTGSG